MVSDELNSKDWYKRSHFIDFLVLEIFWISIVISITVLWPFMTPPYMTTCLNVVAFEDNEGSIVANLFDLGSIGSSPISHLSGSNSSSATASHEPIRSTKMFPISTHKFRVHISKSLWQLMSTIILTSFKLTFFLWHFFFTLYEINWLYLFNHRV